MKLGFLHIPRTGGTYLEALLVELGPEKFVNFFGTPENQIVNRIGLIETIEDTPTKVQEIVNNGNWATCKLFSGHFSYNIDKFIQDGSVQYFTILREPIQRTTSFVKRVTSSQQFSKYVSAGIEKIGDDKFWSNFGQYIHAGENKGLYPHEIHGFSNYMVKAIGGGNLNDPNLVADEKLLAKAKENLDSMYYVGTFEQYEKTVKDILQIFNVEARGNFKPIEKSTVPGTALELLTELNRFDIELYRYFLSKHE